MAQHQTEPVAAPPPEEDLNPYHIAQVQFDRAARYLPDLRPGLGRFLKKPNRLVTVEFPIQT